MSEKSNQKIDGLLKELTLKEKIGMIHGKGLFRTEGVPRLGISPLKMADGPMGVRNEFHNDTWIPIGYTDDYVTYLPSAGALASTWNRELAYKAGQVLGREARGRGKDIILAPGINIKRSPLCGRNFEYISEDPYLTQEMAVPFIKGIQESDVAACVKHFVANNQETERLWVDVEVNERALREIYLPAFEAAIQKADAYSLMGAYNLIYGEHCCQSRWLLNDILREEWGYEGVVVSDWGGVHDTKSAAESGLDIEMSVTNNFDDYCMANPLIEAIQQGQIDEKHIDDKVRHILLLMDKLKMLGGGRKSGDYNTPEHREIVRDIARESIVLLKNEDNQLPLQKEKLKKILVIGDNAERIHSNGGGSAEIKALYEISPLMGLRSRLGGNTEITFARGYYVEPKKEEDEVNWQEASLERVEPNRLRENLAQEVLDKRKTLLDEAIALAKEADEIIFIGGLNHDHDLEGNDRKDITLPYGQNELIDELLKIQPNTVVVMVAGSPIEMEQWREKTKAIVWMGYAGMEGGNALADMLLGNINPSGKLAETFIKKNEDCPAHTIGEFPGGKTVAYTEGIMVGYRYYDTYQIEPAFPFGYGMSYTTFDYKKMNIEVKEHEVIIRVVLENIGERAGEEIIQVYSSQNKASVIRPKKELKAFEKIYLETGEIKEVCIILAKKDLGYYDVKRKMKYTERGYYTILIGSSSRDIKLAQSIWAE